MYAFAGKWCLLLLYVTASSTLYNNNKLTHNPRHNNNNKTEVCDLSPMQGSKHLCPKTHCCKQSVCDEERKVNRNMTVTQCCERAMLGKNGCSMCPICRVYLEGNQRQKTIPKSGRTKSTLPLIRCLPINKKVPPTNQPSKQLYTNKQRTTTNQGSTDKQESTTQQSTTKQPSTNKQQTPTNLQNITESF